MGVSLFFRFPLSHWSSGGIWLNCFIHGLTIPSSCFLLSPVISSKVPDLQLLTPSSGLCSQLWGADSSVWWEMEAPPFKERVFSPHSCPSQCLHGLGQIICSHSAAFSRGFFVHLHLGGGDFSQARTRGQELIPRQQYLQWDLEYKVRCLEAGIYICA